MADRTGLAGLSAMRERRSAHDPDRVIRDLAVTLAAGGEPLTDLGGLRGQEALFGRVALDSTAFPVVEKSAEIRNGSEPSGMPGRLLANGFGIRARVLAESRSISTQPW